MTTQQAEKVCGTLKRVFREKGSWFAGKIETPDGQTIDISGVAPGGVPSPGSELVLTGDFSTHPVYGKQFKIKTLTAVLPSTREGTFRFLATFPGIGPGRAAKIWDAWGQDASRIITEEPHRLAEIKGLGSVTDGVVLSVATRAEDIRIESTLCNMGFGPRTREAIAEQFGDSLAKILAENPYRLVSVRGVSFAAVDNAVMALGRFPVESPFRAAAAVLQVLKDEADSGHTWVPVEGIETLLGKLKLTYPIPEDARAGGIERAVETGMIRRILMGDGTEAVGSGAIGYATPFLAKAEEGIATRLAELLRGAQGEVPEIPDSRLDGLTDAQKEAVRAAVTHRVSVLTGGPGTGKTHTTRAIIAELGTEGVVVVAPTGKAAKRASELTGAVAYTMHRLAGMLKEAATDEAMPRVLIADEASMACVDTLQMLLNAVTRSDLRIVFVGDVDQLPSVGAGRVLGDLIDSGVVPVTRLTQIMRQAEASRIITNAHALNRGLAMNHEPTARDDWFFIRGEDDSSDIEALAARIVSAVARAQDKWGYSIHRGEIMVLSGVKAHKVLGVKALNTLLRDAFNPNRGPDAFGFSAGDRVLVTENDYGLGVVNGDVGNVVRVLTEKDSDIEGRAEKPKVFVSLDGASEREVAFDASNARMLQQAWAMTVHKAQGSEAPLVVVICHHAMNWALQRCLLYTAITRARERVILVGTAKGIAIATRNNETTKRYTRLAGLLRGACRGMGVET